MFSAARPQIAGAPWPWDRAVVPPPHRRRGRAVRLAADIDWLNVSVIAVVVAVADRVTVASFAVEVIVTAGCVLNMIVWSAVVVSSTPRTSEIFAPAFRCASLDPPIDHGDLLVCQSTIAVEGGRLAVRFPRRHVPLRGDIRDLTRPPSDLLVGDKAERRIALALMAGRTVRVDDGSDVFREGRRLARRRRE